LPTAFGNAIKAFEVYPRDVYGADGPPIWPRLTTVIPKDFLDQVQDVRSQIDFLVNTCFFSALIAGAALTAMLLEVPWGTLLNPDIGEPHLFLRTVSWTKCTWAFIASVVSWGCYRWAVTRVPAWGDLVMTAFDCYLLDLAAKLGFAPPSTNDGRTAFWTSFSQMLVYRRDPDGRLPFLVEDWPRVVQNAGDGQTKAAEKSGADENT
jgi:hypothetical protein